MTDENELREQNGLTYEDIEILMALRETERSSPASQPKYDGFFMRDESVAPYLAMMKPAMDPSWIERVDIDVRRAQDSETQVPKYRPRILPRKLTSHDMLFARMGCAQKYWATIQLPRFTP